MSDLIKQVSKLVDVKSIVTLVMTAGMIVMLTGAVNPSQEATTLFSTAYGSIITYFFTRKQDSK